MKIAGLQKLSLVDYPSRVACVLFTVGCNYKCPFCHNSSLIDCNQEGSIKEEEIFNYLKKREGIIDAVVVSGGEPTLQPDLKDFLKKLRNYKQLIKLDTNGSNPKLLKELIDEQLIDYVAMDIKNSFSKYALTCGLKTINLDNIQKSIELLKQNKVPYEFRTTIVKELHNLEDIKQIMNIIGSSSYYLQNFQDTENVVYDGFHGFSDDELININKEFPSIKLRGLTVTEKEEG